MTNPTININYNRTTKHNSNFVSEYVRHDADVFTDDLELFGNKYPACCQNGLSFYHNDINTPFKEFELSDQSGALVCAMYEIGDDPTDEELEEFSEEFEMSLDLVSGQWESNYEVVTDFVFECNHDFEEYKIKNKLSDDPDMWNDNFDSDATLKSPSDATSLSNLVDIINALDELAEKAEEKGTDMYDATDFPTFGGKEPSDTTEIFSWDEEDILLYGTTLENNGWYTTSREEV